MPKTKLPKRIAGVKVPKELRRTAERAIDRANSPAGREMIAAGLSMAAAAATAALVKARTKDAQTGTAPVPPAAPAPPQPPIPPVPPVPPRADAATPPPPLDPQAISDAIGRAAEAMLGQVFGKRKA